MELRGRSHLGLPPEVPPRTHRAPGASRKARLRGEEPAPRAEGRLGCGRAVPSGERPEPGWGQAGSTRAETRSPGNTSPDSGGAAGARQEESPFRLLSNRSTGVSTRSSSPSCGSHGRRCLRRGWVGSTAETWKSSGRERLGKGPQTQTAVFPRGAGRCQQPQGRQREPRSGDTAPRRSPAAAPAVSSQLSEETGRAEPGLSRLQSISACVGARPAATLSREPAGTAAGRTDENCRLPADAAGRHAGTPVQPRPLAEEQLWDRDTRPPHSLRANQHLPA